MLCESERLLGRFGRGICKQKRREDEKREWRCALVASNVFFFFFFCPEIFVKWRFGFQIGMKNLKIAILYTKFHLQEAKNIEDAINFFLNFHILRPSSSQMS